LRERPHDGHDRIGWPFKDALAERTGQRDFAELRSLQGGLLKVEPETAPDARRH